MSGMLKNGFAYEVNGFCTRFANYFFAISLQDRQIVISSQFKKLERLVSSHHTTNIFKTCSIGRRVENVKNSFKKKFIIKKIMLIFSKAHDMIYGESFLCLWFLTFANPKITKRCLKKSIKVSTKSRIQTKNFTIFPSKQNI